MYPRRAKYGNTKVLYNGVKYDSKREANYAAELDLRLYAKDIAAWGRQLRVKLEANGQKICVYVIDFDVTELDGTHTLVEVKGFETAEWKLKKKLLEILWLPEHVGYNYQVVK